MLTRENPCTIRGAGVSCRRGSVTTVLVVWARNADWTRSSAAMLSSAAKLLTTEPGSDGFECGDHLQWASVEGLIAER